MASAEREPITGVWGLRPPDGFGEAGGEAPLLKVYVFCVVICLK